MDNRYETELHHLDGKVISYKDSEYLVYSYKKTLGWNVIFTDKQTLSLLWSQLQEIRILRDITREDRIKANQRKEGIREKQQLSKGSKDLRIVPSKRAEKKQKSSVGGLTTEEEEYIIENWHLIGSRGCKKELEIESRALILEVVDKHDLRAKKKNMAKPQRFSDDDKLFIKENWNNFTQEALYKKFNCSLFHLMNLAKELNLPKKTRFVAPVVFKADEEVTKKSDISLYKNMNLPKIKVEKIVDKPKDNKLKIKDFSEEDILFIKENWNKMPNPELCAHFGITLLVFKRSIAPLNLPKKKKFGRPPVVVSDELKEKILVLWNDGKTPNQIQKALNITYVVWNKNVNSFKLPERLKPVKEAKPKGRKQKELSENDKALILKMWNDGKTPNQIQKSVGLTYMFWKNNVGSFKLPVREKPVRIYEKKLEKTFTAEEVLKIRENWMHKPVEWFLKEFGLTYVVFNKLVKPLNLPVKRKVRTGEKKDKIKKLSKIELVENALENYNELMDIIIESQSNGDNIILKQSKDGYELTDENGSIIWSNYKISNKFSDVDYFATNKPWSVEEDTNIKKSMLSYNRNRNIFILENNLECGINDAYPIKNERMIDLNGYQTFSEFLKELSIKIGRREHMIRRRLEKFQLMEFKEIIRAENVTSKKS